MKLSFKWLSEYLSLDSLLLVVTESILGELSNRLSLEVKNVWNSAAGESNECQERACPLVSQAVIHLLSEQNGGGAPH